MGNRKIELLAPAGNFEKLEAAVHFGADAVYLGGRQFSLRNHSGNFTDAEIADAVAYAHAQGVRVYVACNVFARNNERDSIYTHLEEIAKAGADAVIVADPGIFMAAKAVLGSDVAIHVSTQANTTSLLSATFWAAQGARRINAARELSLSEIKAIAASVPIEVEAFVHGAMCVAYSGRCLLSHYLAGRDGNRGLCAHACRWRYFLVEEHRPGEYLPVSEDERGTYFFNARDLCMIDHIPAMIEAGIASLKIEGRMKGLNYLAATVKTYRLAIDACYENPAGYRVRKDWRREMESVNYRGYSTGFYMSDAESVRPVYTPAAEKSDHRFLGKICSRMENGGITVDIKNRVMRGDAVEIIGPKGPPRKNRVLRVITDTDVDAAAAQPNMKVSLVLEQPDACMPGDILRQTKR